MTRFGDFNPLCRSVTSYPWCNLFYRQLQRISPGTLVGLSSDASTAPVGINPKCGIPSDENLPNIANIVLCAVSFFFVVFLVVSTHRRKAAVGRIEFRALLVCYALTLIFQLLTTGAFLEQGSTALVVLTAIHAGFVAATFAALLGNSLVATQIVEDGTMSSMIPFTILCIALFAATTYISLDVALGVTETISSEPLHSVPLFVFTSIWPGACALIFLGIMSYIVLAVLNEVKPLMMYILGAVLFVLGELAGFLLGTVICEGTGSKVDASFVSTILLTGSMTALWMGWRGITEESWDEGTYYS